MAHSSRIARNTISLAALALTFVFAPRAQAAGTDNAITGVDAWTSTVFQQGQSSFSGVGLRVDLANSTLPNVEFMPTIEYWRNSSNVKEFGIKSARRDATLAADARYNFPTHGTIHPYAGGGLGLHFVQSEVDAPTLGLNHAQDSVVKAGLDFMVGAQFGNERFGNFIEVKYHELAGYRQFKLNIGMNWHLGVASKPAAPASK